MFEILFFYVFRGLMKYFLIMTKNIPQKTKYGRFKCSTEDFENAVRAMKSGNLSTKKHPLILIFQNQRFQ